MRNGKHSFQNIDKKHKKGREGKEEMKQIRIGGFVCKAKDLSSKMEEFIKKAEKELKKHRKIA